MPKAGPLTTSVSHRVGPAEILVGDNHHANAMQALSNAQSPQPPAGFRHRLHSDETVIGLALGSPRYSRTLAMSPNEADADVPCVHSSPDKPVSSLKNAFEIGSENRSIKRKRSKWRSLGSFFGRREVRSASPCYQLDQKQQSMLSKQVIIRDQLEKDLPRRQWVGSNHDSKGDRVHSSKHMFREYGSGSLRRTSSRRRDLRRRELKEPQLKMQPISAEYTAHAFTKSLDPYGEQQGSRMPESSLLHVEIPCVAMERYSVMFSEVLKTQGRQSKRQSSLLACGQAHPEGLHTVAKPNSKVRYLIEIGKYYH